MKRRDFLKATSALVAGGATIGGIAPATRAQGASNTLISVSEAGPNSLDVQAPGANRSSFEVAWNVYDRLISNAPATDAKGNARYAADKFAPELAEEWDLGPRSVTFTLRADATFHDGAPVTAKDVKWSLDRAVSLPGFPKGHMALSSLTDPAQFVVLDDRRLRIDFARADRLTMATLADPVPVIYNSGLAKKHASDGDPWAVTWLRHNTAAGGAYKVTGQTGDQGISYQRNEQWKSGPMPAIERVIWRVVPSAATRRALIERGDADISLDLPPKDVDEMAKQAPLKVVSTPIDNAVQYLGMNVTMPPFDKPAVRQAIAYAVPYEAIVGAAFYGRARALFGGDGKVTSAAWPQPTPYHTDLAKAKALLAQAGLPNGFATTLSYDVGTAVTNEPLCLLVQGNLAKIGVTVTLDKVASGNWRTALIDRKLPFLTNFFGPWFSNADYFFHEIYHGKSVIFNTSAYDNPAMNKLIDAARFESDPKTYDTDIEGCIALAFADMPSVPLLQPYFSVAMQKRIDGYRYWFHRQLDYRPLHKA